jgi:hypothetical protein
MITACCARAPYRCMSRTYMHCLLMFYEVRPISKTRNQLTLQRHLMKYLMKAPLPVREIGAVMALLPVSHQLQDLLDLKDFERQHHCQ